MSPFRVSLLNCMIILAIFGLFTSVPIQCQRAAQREDSQIAAEFHADRSKELTIMAEHVANGPVERADHR